VIYRPATLDDVPEIVGVVTQMVAGTAFAPPTAAKVARFIGGNSYHESVWNDGRMVAFMCGYASETFLNDEFNAYERALFVLPEHRGGSIAVRLVRNFELWARTMGCKNVWLGQSVGQNIDSTRRFFERLGYECQGFMTRKSL
jgi:GNAT superfamily N-acetyltransferase